MQEAIGSVPRTAKRENKGPRMDCVSHKKRTNAGPGFSGRACSWHQEAIGSIPAQGAGAGYEDVTGTLICYFLPMQHVSEYSIMRKGHPHTLR